MEDTGSSLGGDDTGGPVALNIAEPNLAFHDISYTIPTGILCKGSAKVILDSVSGILYPGVNAIMGPTGSGKTTLLDILANRKSSSRVTGTVMFNSTSIKPNFRFKTGYVVQDDIVTGSLTVRENLNFSAALRLSSKTTNSQRRARVEKVIAELNLHNCADQKIGTEFIRGVSGGERKRTNIGMELIIEPQILFLDEPTTGLDAHTAVSVVQLLKDLTVNGDKIVVMSIHQPRFAIFKQFDTLTLLSLGELIFHGGAQDSLGYFNEIGFKCEEHDNPADFFLDVIDSCEEKKGDNGGKDTPTQRLLEKSDTLLDLPESFLHSKAYRETQGILQPMIKREELSTQAYGTFKKTASDLCSNPYATSIYWQFLVVAYRSALKMWRNPMTNIIQLIVMVLFGLITGGIYFQRPETPRGMQDRLGAFFFIVLSQVFGGLGAIELFIKEKLSFLHETSSGYYRVSVFFVAKVITDLLILRTIPIFVFAAITYFMIGLQADVSNFFLYCLTLSLTTIAGAAIAFTFSALVNVFAVANLLVSLVFVFYMLFGGALIGLSSLPSWIRWMKYVSVFRYSVEALVVNELKDQLYIEELPVVNGTVITEGCFNVTTNAISNISYCVADGNQFLHFQGYEVDWPWYADQLALLAMGILWLCLTYSILRLAKKYYEHYK